ncbi:hypothetical protein FACS1894219_11920 [Clostridia bacterium]|nr:hypothetical protein FACS1894219_11920 [Clostridia bacterium]
MTADEIKKVILSALDEIGVYFDDQDIKSETDIDLREYIVDSLQFISFVVELEHQLCVEYPDDLLLYDNIASLDGLSNAIYVRCFS